MLLRTLSRSLVSIAGQSFPRKIQFLLILDFEATCGDTVHPDDREIIEFPTLLYNVRQKKVQATFQEYVRPMLQPTLTEFCTALTGITQVCLSVRRS